MQQRNKLLEQLAQGRDVTLRHLQRFVLGKLAIVAQRRHNIPELIERRVQVVHAPPFAGIGRQAALLHHLRRHGLQLAFEAATDAQDAAALAGVGRAFVIVLGLLLVLLGDVGVAVRRAQRRRGGARCAHRFGRRRKVVDRRRGVVVRE